MGKIYLTKVERCENSGLVRLAAFLKERRERTEDLIGFLRNQNIECSEILPDDPGWSNEFSYFDVGFYLSFAAERWSFYEFRSFLSAYVESWDEDVLIRDELSAPDQSGGAAVQIFDDTAYLQLYQEIDRCKERYYRESMSISLFIDGILKLLVQNLQLYWAAARLMDMQSGKLTYLNYFPPSLPRREILRGYESSTTKTVKKPIIFCEEEIAELFLRPGPFSPSRKTIDDFLTHILLHVDDFLYGDLIHKRISYRLRKELAELKQNNESPADEVPASPIEEERGHKARRKLHLLLLGASQLSSGQAYGEFARFGFDKKNVELHTEYSKLKSFDINNLLLIRSRCDGILLGALPHRMKGNLLDGDSLILQMEQNPKAYPPFVVLRDKGGGLKITKTSLHEGLCQLVEKIEKIGKYTGPESGA
ncbi:MAG: hypothetical protein A2X49_15615 [Lentisphaerae bacterium GWF2_52_8]|nr:MAG: hypothetical protein A2X49_15615 [Lentisphaerae bacterium GWF2_52_8]